MATILCARWKILTPCATVLMFAVVVGTAELVLSRIYPQILWEVAETGDQGFMFYQFDPRLGLWHKPGWSTTVGPLTFTSNRKGLRDREVPYGKPDGRQRIAVLGDSLTWGYGVGDGETFSDVLESRMPNTDVINLGVAGYGNGQELLLLRYEGLRYQPDRVMVVFCEANDVEDNYFADAAEAYPVHIFGLQDGKLRIDRFRLGPVLRLGIALNDHSHLFNFVHKKLLWRSARRRGMRPVNPVERMNRERLALLPVDESAFADLHYLEMGDCPEECFGSRGRLLRATPINYYKVELTKVILAEIARTARAGGARPLIVLAPFKAELDAGSPYSRNPVRLELLRFLEAEHIQVVDLLPLMVEAGHDPDELFLDSMHFSVRGHRLVAHLLQRALDRIDQASRPAPAQVF